MKTGGEESDDTHEELSSEAEIRLEQERAEILAAVAAAKPDTLVNKVAWILNNYPEARNSDITLQLRYWATFASTLYSGGKIDPEDLYKLPRLTSLSRARARIQNTLKLFLAEADVRKHRGTLSDEEHQDAVNAKISSAPVYNVYVDESGKTQRYLVVGSLWILQGPEVIRIASKLFDWRIDSGFKDELHFSEIDQRSAPYYKQAVDTIVDNASALSLKYVAVPRAGTGATLQTVPKLIYHLISRGVAHEHLNGRAPLPRNLNIWKDEEEVGYDKLVLADIGDRLKNTAAAQFEGKLTLGLLQAMNSKDNDLLQIADLFTASINRILNAPDPPPKIPGPKDEVANYVIRRTGLVLEAEADEQFEDLAVRINI